MDIKIQIELDGRVIELTIEEARALHEELDFMFGANPVYPIPIATPSQQRYPICPTWTGTPYYPESDQQCSTS